MTGRKAFADHNRWWIFQGREWSGWYAVAPGARRFQVERFATYEEARRYYLSEVAA